MNRIVYWVLAVLILLTSCTASTSQHDSIASGQPTTATAAMQLLPMPTHPAASTAATRMSATSDTQSIPSPIPGISTLSSTTDYTEDTHRPRPRVTPDIVTTLAVTPTKLPATPTPATFPTITQPTICTEEATVFDLQNLLGMTEITDVDFLGMSALQVAGWRPRSFLNNPTGPDIPPVIFERTVIDLASGEMTSVNAPPESLLRNPCPNCRGVQLLDESPDGNWQLVTTTTGDGEGVWLVSADIVTQLTMNIPWDLRWVWADDNSQLWLTFYTAEYSSTPVGRFFLSIGLEPSPTINLHTNPLQSNALAPLNPGQYNLTFSPSQKHILSVPMPHNSSDSDDERFFLYDATVTPPVLVWTGEPIKGLTAAIWDETLNAFLLVVAEEGSVKFQTLDGFVVLQLQTSALAPVFPNSGGEALDHYVYGNIDYALSADMKVLAIGYGSVEGLALIHCTTPP